MLSEVGKDNVPEKLGQVVLEYDTDDAIELLTLTESTRATSAGARPRMSKGFPLRSKASRPILRSALRLLGPAAELAPSSASAASKTASETSSSCQGSGGWSTGRSGGSGPGRFSRLPAVGASSICREVLKVIPRFTAVI